MVGAPGASPGCSYSVGTLDMVRVGRVRRFGELEVLVLKVDKGCFLFLLSLGVY